MRLAPISLAIACLLCFAAPAFADKLPLVDGVELQPLVSATARLAEALEFAGAPLSPENAAALKAAGKNPNPVEAVKQIQQVLDPLCLAKVTLNPDSRVSAVQGPVKKEQN